MRCTKYLEIISAFVDSEATPLEQLAMQEHIKNCPHCKAELSNQYALKEMVVDKFKCGDSFDISFSVMNRIKAGDTVANVNDVEIKVHSSKWVAAAVLTVALLTTVFAINFDKKEIAADSSAKTYASYIYDHLNDSDFIADAGEYMINQASFIK